MDELRSKLKTLESQVTEDQSQREQEVQQLRDQARSADEEHHRKLQEAEAGFRERLVKRVDELNAEYDERIARETAKIKSDYEDRMAATAADQQERRQELIERIVVGEAENDELRARPSAGEIPTELIELRAQAKHHHAMEEALKAQMAELREHVATLKSLPIGLSSTRSHRSSHHSHSADGHYEEEEEEEEEQDSEAEV